MNSLSVIIPVYNAAATLPRTLASLEKIAPQHRTEVEVIAVNDGSWDDSLTLLRRAESECRFRLRVIDQANYGVSAARNAALTVAGGEWVFFLDADDELYFDPCAVLSSATSETCFGFSLEYRREGRIISRLRPQMVTRQRWADVLTARNPFGTSSLLLRRRCIKQPFDERIAFGEDWLFWMSNLALFEHMKIRPEITSALIHLHGGNTSTRFAQAGAGRSSVAQIVEQTYGEALTRRQRNNLYLQHQIGKLQQARKVPVDTFWRFPCDPLLYLKLWVYALSALVHFQATPYRGYVQER